MKKILILNGPNLNLLGKREPTIYGSETMEQVLAGLEKAAAEHGAAIEYAQSNHEGELVDIIQRVGFDTDGYAGIVLNAGAYTHTSIALLDCIRSLRTPVIEVHISNVHAREAFRNQSVISSGCLGVIAGFGLDSYRLAIDALIEAGRKGSDNDDKTMQRA